MQTNSSNRFLIKWISITSFGWLLAQTIGIFITSAVFPKAEHAVLPSSPLYFGVFGLLLGLAQWICIRERIPNSFRWVITTAIGFFITALTLKLLNRFEVINSFLRVFPLFAYFFAGMVVGFAQYQTIKKILRKAYWWIIVVAISWVISQVFIRMDDVAIDFLGVLVFAMVTGLAFVWLVKNPYSEIQPAYQ